MSAMEVHRLLMAIRKHVEEMDAIMLGPDSYERGRKIADSVDELNTAAGLSKSSRPRRKTQR